MVEYQFDVIFMVVHHKNETQRFPDHWNHRCLMRSAAFIEPLKLSSGTMNASGQVTITTVNKKNNPSFTFTIDSATHATNVYAPSDNAEDSDNY